MGDDVGTKRQRRFRVHLSVSYGVAKEFVAQYAENLSRGGIFIAGAERLVVGQEVDVDLGLPGAGATRVRAKVVHIIDGAQAERLRRKPGAGLEIVGSPPGFADDLSSYLLRLGRRADVLVLASDEGCGLLLAAAGYQVRPMPPPSDLVAMIARSERTIAAIVLGSDDEPAYRPAARAAGVEDLIVVMDAYDQLDEVLARIDQEL